MRWMYVLLALSLALFLPFCTLGPGGGPLFVWKGKGFVIAGVDSVVNDTPMVYRWKDFDGVWHESDHYPDPGVQFQTLNVVPKAKAGKKPDADDPFYKEPPQQ